MNNKDLLKLLDDIHEDEDTVLKDENRILIIDGLNLFLRNFSSSLILKIKTKIIAINYGNNTRIIVIKN